MDGKDDRRCSASPLNKCKKMGKHLCAGCGEEVYCSKECQKEHWAAHKLSCQLAVKPESTVIMKDFQSLSIKQLKNVLKAKVANFESKKRESIISRMDNIIEKPVLVKLVCEYVTLPEVESLLSNKSTANQGSSSSSGGRNRGSSSSSRGSKSSGQPTPTPEQLKQQATMMRQNPQMVRNMQPAFKNMTDDQIKSYADQLEQAAADPAMMKEMEKMSKLSDSDRSSLQNIQEGLTGNRTIDSDWMDSTIQTLKAKPNMFKTLLTGKMSMLGGVTDDQVNSFVDMASNMDAYFLKLIMRLIVFLSSMAKPAMDMYKVVDDYTLGCAKYLGMVILVYVAYYCGLGMWIGMKWTYRQLRALFLLAYYASSGTAGGTGVGGEMAKAAGASMASSASPEAVGAAAATGAAAAAAAAKSNSKGSSQKKSASPDDEFEF